jgi:hypothetical protein
MLVRAARCIQLAWDTITREIPTVSLEALLVEATQAFVSNHKAITKMT